MKHHILKQKLYSFSGLTLIMIYGIVFGVQFSGFKIEKNALYGCPRPLLSPFGREVSANERINFNGKDVYEISHQFCTFVLLARPSAREL